MTVACVFVCVCVAVRCVCFGYEGSVREYAPVWVNGRLEPFFNIRTVARTKAPNCPKAKQ